MKACVFVMVGITLGWGPLALGQSETVPDETTILDRPEFSEYDNPITPGIQNGEASPDGEVEEGPDDSFGVVRFEFGSGSVPQVVLPTKIDTVFPIGPHNWHPSSKIGRGKIDRVTPELRSLAAALDNDERKIFLHVRDKVKTERGVLAQKGAMVTHLVGSGGMGDKAALLAALLVAAGNDPATVSYQMGSVMLPLLDRKGQDVATMLGVNPHGLWPIENVSESKFAEHLQKNRAVMINWLRETGVHFEAKVVSAAGVVGNAPSDLAGVNAVLMRRMWVVLEKDGKVFHMDPSFHASYPHQANSLPGIHGFGGDDFVNGVGGVLVAGNRGIQGIDHNEVKKRMNGIWTKFLNGFKAGGAFGDMEMDDLVSRVRRTELLDYPIQTRQELEVYGVAWRVHLSRPGFGIPGAVRRCYGEMPLEMVMRLRLGYGQRTATKVVVGSFAGVDCVFMMAALEGERLMLTIGDSGNGMGQGYLWVGDERVGGATTMGGGASYWLEMKVEGLPTHFNVMDLSLDPSGTLRNFTPWAGFMIKAGTRHVISYLNRTSRAFISHRLGVLREYQKRNIASTDRRVQGEALNLMAATWVDQTQAMSELCVGVTGGGGVGVVDRFHLYRIGRAALAPRAMIDFPFQRSGSFIWGSGEVLERINARTRLVGLIESAMEHGVLEQMVNSSTVGVSTAKVIATQNSQGAVNYVLGRELRGAVVESQLNLVGGVTTTGYPKEVLSKRALWEVLRPGSGEGDDKAVVILPRSGRVKRGNYTGWAAAGLSGSGFQMQIGGGGYFGFGGLLASSTSLSPPYLGTITGLDPTIRQPLLPNGGGIQDFRANSLNFASNEPIDMRTGAYFYDATDVVLPGQPGVTFSRHYSTADRYSRRGRMGWGWAHNFERWVDDQTEYDMGLGRGRPEDAAAFLGALVVGEELMMRMLRAAEAAMRPGEAGNVGAHWAIRTRCGVSSALVANWAVDGLKDNAVLVNLGHQTLQFLRLPAVETQTPGEEKFLSPAGMQELSLELRRVNPNSSSSPMEYVLNRRNAGRMLFRKIGAKFRCFSDEDVHGNKVQFRYNGGNLVDRVSVLPMGVAINDPTLPFIELGYDGSSRVNVVRTRFGVAARYRYDAAGNLVKASQRTGGSAGRGWEYSYDSEQRMTKLTDPDGRVMAENVYDLADRVVVQYALGRRDDNVNHAWLYRWGGSVNVEVDPKGGETRYFYDERGRATEVMDAIGHRKIFESDEEDRVVREYGLDREGGVTSLTRRVFDGRGLLMQEHDFHVVSGESNEAEMTVSEYEIPAHLATFYDYNPMTLLLERVRRGSDKSGLFNYSETASSIAGLVTESEITYEIGKVNVATVKDALGRVTSYLEYDVRGNAKRVRAPGPLETTTMYDVLGRPVKIVHSDLTETNYLWTLDPTLTEEPAAVYNKEGLGRVTQVSLPIGAGKVVATTSGLVSVAGTGATVTTVLDKGTVTFDATGNAVARENGSGAVWRSSYDRFGNQLTEGNMMGECGLCGQWMRWGQ